MSQHDGKRSADSYPSGPPAKKQFKDVPKKTEVTIAGLSKGTATTEDSEYGFPSRSTIQLPPGSSIYLPSSAGYVTPREGSVVYLPISEKEVLLSHPGTLVAPGDARIKIGTATCTSVGIPELTYIKCGNTLKHPEPLTETLKITHRLTLPSKLTLSPQAPTRLPGPLVLAQRPHIGGSPTINHTIRLQPGIINLRDSLELPAETKLGGACVIMRSITLKKEIKLAGSLRLKNDISVPATTNITQVSRPASEMEVDQSNRPKTLLVAGSTLPADFVIPAGVQLLSTTVLPKGTILPEDFAFPPGSIIPAGTKLPAATIIPGGAVLPEGIELHVGTILPVIADK